MKKKYVITVLSVLVIAISAILLINKSSYAGEIDLPNTCPETIRIVTEKENLSLIKTDYTTISLPKDINVKDSNENYLDKYAIQLIRNKNIQEIENMDLAQEEGGLGEKINLIPNFSKNKEENRYYTQIAFWWLIDKLMGLEDEYNYDFETKSQLPIESNENEKYDAEGNYKFANQVSALEKKTIKESPNGEKIEKFINFIDQTMASGQSLSDIEDNDQLGNLNPINTEEITYHVTNDYIETNLITPTAQDVYYIVFKEYEVKVSSPIIVVDENGNEKTKFNSLEGFKLRIPISEIKDGKINFKAEIIGKMRFDQWGMYSADRILESAPLTLETRQAVTPNAVLINCGTWMSEQFFHPLELNYDIAVGNLNIKVIDAESKEDLSNAEVVIYGQAGNIVYRYKTTGSTLNITLPVGEYTVKQIITPPNYQARVVEQKVTITENGETDAVLENVQLIEVPDTNKTAGILPIIGLIILIGGMLTITIMLKKMRYTKGR